ncbi:MAG TPA: glycosyltransferase family 39 protein [Flavobacteriales bacterium]|nr:glycosyltransferase family 39 protein [Flavobacteriales bacterium]
MDWRAHIARYGQRWFPGEPWAKWTFLALWLLAAVLRFWDLSHLPYTHDELSALVRIYPTLWETIQRGVIELDTHPPGVQVFEWAWTKLFGMNEPIVKLPFIVLSLVALFLLYRFALKWTSAPTALATIALLTAMQYTVMYAQVARPYAIGLFTTALLADQLTGYLASGRRRQLAMVGVASVFSAYTHHFALLLAGLMVFTGLLLIQRQQRKAYLIMCTIAMVAYLPNLPIFLKQLSLGGLAEWLAAPDKYWLSDHLRWLTHFSTPFAVLVTGVVALALFLRLQQRLGADPSRWFLPLWGLLPLLIGIAYSLWRAPVIQYSMLLFSFPYVLIALFAGLRGLPRPAAMAIPLLLALFATHSLVFQRHHYGLFYTSKYGSMVDRGVEALRKHGPENTLILYDAPEPQIQFYRRSMGLAESEFPYVQLRGDVNAGQLDDLLRRSKGKVVVLGVSNGSRGEHAARIQAHFPYLWERLDLPEGQVMVLADRPGYVSINDRSLIAEASPEKRTMNDWDIHTDLPVIRDSSGHPTAWDLNGRTFGVACRMDLTREMLDPRDLFEVVVDVEAPDTITDLGVIIELVIGDSTVLYRSAELDQFPRGGPVSLVIAAARADVQRGPYRVLMGTYIYNRDNSPVLVQRMRIYRREANPVQYALLHPVTRLARTP